MCNYNHFIGYGEISVQRNHVLPQIHPYEFQNTERPVSLLSLRIIIDQSGTTYDHFLFCELLSNNLLAKVFILFNRTPLLYTFSLWFSKRQYFSQTLAHIFCTFCSPKRKNHPTKLSLSQLGDIRPWKPLIPFQTYQMATSLDRLPRSRRIRPPDLHSSSSLECHRLPHAFIFFYSHIILTYE